MADTDLKRAFSEDGAFKTHIGGQALIEGVMMRGKTHWSVCVRDGLDSYYEEVHPLSKHDKRPSWMEWPFVRGCVALVDSLVLGYKALEVSATHALMDFEVEETKAQALAQQRAIETNPSLFDHHVAQDMSSCANQEEQNPDAVISEGFADKSNEEGSGAQESKSAEKKDDEEFGTKEMILSALLGIVLGVALFIFFPAAVSNLLIGDYDVNPLAWNCIDGVFRVLIFVFYVWLIGRMKDIKRMFAYHGAEHKSIHCFEHGLELTPENARQFPRLHVRCGTAFLIMVMIIAILVYTILPLDSFIAFLGVSDSVAKFLLVLAVRILFMPLIAGISYEITVKWAGSHPENPLVKVILWPGMQMQYLTTNEPDDIALEAAIRALKLVAETEQE